MMINSTWWCLVSIGQCWLVCGSNGSVWGGVGLYLVILGPYGAVLVGTWWKWVSVGRSRLVLVGNGSV